MELSPPPPPFDPELLSGLIDVFLHDVEEGLVLTDATTQRIVEVNDAYCRMVGYARAELVGETATELGIWQGDVELERFARQVEQGNPAPRAELWIRRRDGATFLADVGVRFVPVADRLYALGVVVDVTERRRAERTLRDVTEQLDAVVSQTDEIVIEFDAETRVLDVWTGNRALLVRPLDEIRGRSVEELLDDRTARLFREAVPRVLATGEPASIHYDVHIGGQTQRRHGRLSRIRGRDGRDDSVVLYARDVTERHRAEEELRRSEASARLLFLESPVAMWIWDAETFAFLDVNEAAARQYGYQRDELLAMTALEIRAPDEQERLRGVASSDTELAHYGIWRHLRKDGSEVLVDVWSTMIDWQGRRARMSLAIDATDRVRAERSLLEAESRYRSLVETIPAVVYLDRIDEMFSSVYISPQIEPVLGYTPLDWEREPDLWRKLLHPEDRDAILEQGRRHHVQPGPYVMEYRLIAKDGRAVWIRDEAVPIPDASGRLRYWQGFLVDITERKEAELGLRAAEQRYRMVVENISDLVALVDLDGTILYASPSHAKVLGLHADGLVGHSCFELVVPEDVAASRRDFSRAVEGHRTEPRPFRLFDAAGEVIEFEGSGWQPIFDEGGAVQAILAVSRDVTEQHNAERERRKLLLRLVAAGEEERRRIADDVHDAPIQALTALGIRLETLRPRLDAEGQVSLERIAETVEASIRSLRSLMFELRPPVLDREGLMPALRDYLRGVIDQHHPTFEVSVVDHLSKEPPPEARIVLYRIVQEAIVNVRKHTEASQVTVAAETVDDGWRLRVEDDGPGLPDDAQRARTGHIGMIAMRERAEYAGGTFSADARPGGGTVIEVWIPYPE